MKKFLGLLLALSLAAVANAAVWNINWSIFGAYSPEDTTGAMSPTLLQDYNVTWSLINADSGVTLDSMYAAAGSSGISFDETGIPNGRLLEYTDSLNAIDATRYLGSPTSADEAGANIYQYIFIENPQTGDQYEWTSASQFVVPVTSMDVPAKDIDAETIIGNAGIDGVTANWTKVTSVPEPATMSLLGLGALAMVLRRKIRK